MTEGEWLACTDPEKMVKFLRGRESDRKWRLYACACCRDLLWHLLKDRRTRVAVEISERYADRVATEDDLEIARKDVRGARQAAVEAAARAVYGPDGPPSLEEVTLDAVEWVQWAVGNPEAEIWLADGNEQQAWQCRLLRDLFGPLPFRPIMIDRSWLAWHDGLPVSMARRMYKSRDFADISVLADALEEAGCRDADILGHCRAGGEHVRGCWVIDLVLGKS